MKVLITGGAGFVGSSLAKSFTHAGHSVTVFDNLKRRGSEWNLGTFKRLGIEFTHGDIRIPSDFEDVKGAFDLFIEASAEPSVLAGVNNSPRRIRGRRVSGRARRLEPLPRAAASLLYASHRREFAGGGFGDGAGGDPAAFVTH